MLNNFFFRIACDLDKTKRNVKSHKLRQNRTKNVTSDGHFYILVILKPKYSTLNSTICATSVVKYFCIVNDLFAQYPRFIAAVIFEPRQWVPFFFFLLAAVSISCPGHCE